MTADGLMKYYPATTCEKCQGTGRVRPDPNAMSMMEQVGICRPCKGVGHITQDRDKK